jgi:CHAD domain-containing protein
MAASDTWLVRDDRCLPVGHVAANTLRKRLDAVWEELRAACALPADAEHVHQLRVATRRTLAAVDAFRPVIPPKRRDWFEKRLRRLRRAAGEARDLDVLAARLAQNGAALARGRVVAMLARQRHDSRAPIRAQLDRLLDADWPSRVDRLLIDIHGRARRSEFRAFARRRFKPMVKSFFEKADRRLRGNAEIHALRIEGKKLRYALEIFAPVFPEQSRTRCEKSLERLQKTLGDFTDHASAADRFEHWARSSDAGSHHDMLVALRDDENEQADRARKAFSKWWNTARRRSLRRRFQRTLRQSA